MNPMDLMKTVTKLTKRLDSLEKSSKGDNALTTVSVNGMIQKVLRDSYVQNTKDMKLMAGKFQKLDAKRAQQMAKLGVGLQQMQTAAKSTQDALAKELKAAMDVQQKLASELQNLTSRVTQAEKTMSTINLKLADALKQIIKNV